MGETGRTEQIISQLQSKILTAVLTSRIPVLLRDPNAQPASSSSSTRTRRRDRWFNLSLPDLENPKSFDSPLEPHHVDILLSGPDAVGHVVERWSAVCDTPPPPAVFLAGEDVSSLHRRTYKKSIVLLRSVYSFLRLLPCFKIFKMLSSVTHSYNYELDHRISDPEPISQSEEKHFKTYNFTPVESQFGYISVSVTYRYDLSEFEFEASPLSPPMIISDYVGSPAAELARPFRPVPPPSPGRKPRKGSHSFEEFRLSPPFSVSPTPSPPVASFGSLRARMRSETAPVSIPVEMDGGDSGKGNRTANHSDPAKRSFLPPLSPRSTRTENSNQQFYSNPHLCTTQKGLKDGRDDSGRFSSGFSSCGSPRFGFSRSSSRLSIQDDLDDCDFSCPFAVDDFDSSDSQTRNLDGREVPESPQALASSHKSQDAAVGVLVHMLRTAPPLRQDHSYSSQSSRSEVDCEVGNSSFYMPRKTSEALEELRSYREIKDILLSQTRTQLPSSVKRMTE